MVMVKLVNGFGGSRGCAICTTGFAGESGQWLAAIEFLFVRQFCWFASGAEDAEHQYRSAEYGSAAL